MQPRRLGWSLTRVEATSDMHAVPKVGGVMVLVGIIWFFQGIGVLPGSFMTGQTKWAVYGGLTALAGLAMIRVRRRA